MDAARKELGIDTGGKSPSWLKNALASSAADAKQKAAET